MLSSADPNPSHRSEAENLRDEQWIRVWRDALREAHLQNWHRRQSSTGIQIKSEKYTDIQRGIIEKRVTQS